MERVEQRYGGRVTRVSVSVDVEAPAEDVWKVVADPRNLPRWDRHIVAVEGVPATGLQKGTTYTTTVRFMGVRGRVTVDVVELDPPRHATMRLKGLVDATVRTTVSPLADGRSRLDHEVEYRFAGGGLGRLAAQALRLTGGPQFALRRGAMAQARQAKRA